MQVKNEKRIKERARERKREDERERKRKVLLNKKRTRRKKNVSGRKYLADQADYW
jgi:hypothetical protein